MFYIWLQKESAIKVWVIIGGWAMSIIDIKTSLPLIPILNQNNDICNYIILINPI